MKQKRTSTAKPATKDFGKDLYDTIVFSLILLGVLWYLNI
jgi:hypothetical protein